MATPHESEDLEALHAGQLRAFQEALVPNDCRACSFASSSTAFRPAQGPVGGDFHDFFAVDEHRQACLMGDVTGHGLPSALVMAVAFGAVREALRWAEKPCMVLNGLHDLLVELGARSGGPRLFSATLFLALLDDDGRLQHVNAGHPPPVLLRSGEPARELATAYPPLGLAAPERCSSLTEPLRSGDRLVVYTDGVLEPGESHRSMVGRIAAMADREGRDVVESLVARGADDDRTAMVVTYRG